MKKTGLNEREIEMATRLVEGLTETWDPSKYRDIYREDLLTRVKAKVKAGKSTVVTQPEEGKEPRRSAEIIDLMSFTEEQPQGQGRGRHAAQENDDRALGILPPSQHARRRWIITPPETCLITASPFPGRDLIGSS